MQTAPEGSDTAAPVDSGHFSFRNTTSVSATLIKMQVLVNLTNINPASESQQPLGVYSH